MIKQLSFAILAAAALAGSAAAAPPPHGREASIPFISHGGIRDFDADGRDGIYLRGRGRQWYHARLMGSCFNLPFAHAIGVQTFGSNTLDRFATLIVDGERCKIQSLVKSPPPPRKMRRASRRG
jgi:Family of unknown function (DUF6491)